MNPVRQCILCSLLYVLYLNITLTRYRMRKFRLLHLVDFSAVCFFFLKLFFSKLFRSSIYLFKNLKSIFLFIIVLPSMFSLHHYYHLCLIYCWTHLNTVSTLFPNLQMLLCFILWWWYIFPLHIWSAIPDFTVPSQLYNDCQIHFAGGNFIFLRLLLNIALTL